MDKLRPLSEISEVREELLTKYLQLLNPPSSEHEIFRKEVLMASLMDVAYMPYWMVMELDNMDFDISKTETLLF